MRESHSILHVLHTFLLHTATRSNTRDCALDPRSLPPSPPNPTASKYFAAGPPYFATASDFRKIASKWSEFAGRAYSHKPGLLAEMYAWCIAVAHLEMENVLIDSFMISNIAVNKGEGWNLIDNLESPVCSESHMDPKGDTALPTFLHLCQMNRVGEWALHKRKIPRDVFTCEAR